MATIIGFTADTAYNASTIDADTVRIDSNSFNSGWTLQWDDAANGPTLTAGEQADLYLSGFLAGSVTFLGTTAGGEPVLDSGSGSLTVLANGAPYSDGQSVDYSTGGSLTCFLPGTLIATPGGEVAVEALGTGDLVLTAEGRAVPVRWIGRQTVATRFGLGESRFPVRIAPGALGEGLPARALRVTADHALLLDGVLAHAGALVNGTTIRRMTPAELGERFTVFHIETAAHEVILAEGVPTETFLDTASRRRFDNHAEYLALHGADAEPMVERPEPRALSGRQLPPALRAGIAGRAAHLSGGPGEDSTDEAGARAA